MKLPPVVHPLAAQADRAILFEFLAAAVCHATNWDRLRRHLTEAAERNDFEASFLAQLTLAQFEGFVGQAFDDLTTLADRHAMFTSVAEALASPESPLRIEALRPGPQRLEGPSGLYQLLNSLAVFNADPQRKKARLLVQQLYRYRLLEFSDPEYVRPATEYHLMRLYLRTERVVHQRGLDLAVASSRATDIRSVTALRNAVEEAMYYTAGGAAMPIADLNEIEWQVARSFCDRDQPLCMGPPRVDKPVDDAILNANKGSCPFAGICNGPELTHIARLAEPRLASHHAYY